MAVRSARPNLYVFLLAGAGLACSLDHREVSTEAGPSAGSNVNAADDTDGTGGSSSSTPPARGNPSPGIPFERSAMDELATSVPSDGDFGALVVQPAPWADLQVKVTRARLYRGARPAELASSISFSEQNVYAVLDINITQLGNALTDFRTRNTWDLILADGTRLQPLNPLGVSIVTGDSPTVHSYYPGEDTAFEGAALEVNGSDRETVEPLRIPLDTEQVFENEIELTSLVGQIVAPATEGRRLTFEVLDANYGINSLELGRRAPLGLRLVRLNYRATFFGGFSQSYESSRDGPRVSVNGNTLASVVARLDTIDAGESVDFVNVYEIDAAATSFDVVFNTGDPEFARLPVVLPAR